MDGLLTIVLPTVTATIAVEMTMPAKEDAVNPEVRVLGRDDLWPFLDDAIVDLDASSLRAKPFRLVVYRQQREPVEPTGIRKRTRRIPYDEWVLTLEGVDSAEVVDDQGIGTYNVLRVRVREKDSEVLLKFCEKTAIRMRGPSVTFRAALGRRGVGEVIVRMWLCFETRRLVLLT